MAAEGKKEMGRVAHSGVKSDIEEIEGRKYKNKKGKEVA
jgi:hypothetical protein